MISAPLHIILTTLLPDHARQVNADLEALFEQLPHSPSQELLINLCDGLMKVCPFKNNSHE